MRSSRSLRSLTVLLLGSITATACSQGMSHQPPFPRRGTNVSPVDSKRIVAAMGQSEADVRDSIRIATSLGLTARYIEVRSVGHSHIFSPLAEVVRTNRALVVKTARNMYLWPLSEARLYYSASTEPIAIQELPLISSRMLDGYLRPQGVPYAKKLPAGVAICDDCAMIFGSPKSPTKPDTWDTLLDPWQHNPDWSSVQTTPARQPEGYSVCEWDVNGTHCWYYGTYDPSEYYSSDPYYGSGFPQPNATPTPPPPPPCTPPGMPAWLQSVFNGDQPMAAVAQAIAAKNGGNPHQVVSASPPTLDARGVGMHTLNTIKTIYVFPDNFEPYLNAGMTISAMYMHEQLHLWFENRGPDGIRPNPLPGDPGFVANPSVQVINGAGNGITLNFNLLNANGQLNATQYKAYEHLLIHDELVSIYGKDDAWTALVDSMQGATSVTSDGVTTPNMDGQTATVLMNSKSLRYANAYGRAPYHAPTHPDYYNGCSASARPSNVVRQRRDLVNGIDYYNLDGFDLMWDGVPLPP